jgi:hypothetical protein
MQLDLLKAVQGITKAAGLEMSESPAYITAQDVGRLDVVILTLRHCSKETETRLRDVWKEGAKGTVLEHVKLVVVSDGASVKLVPK